MPVHGILVFETTMEFSEMTKLSIGELANAAGVPATTVRYYERAGLLVPETRTSGNYRSYGFHSLERLQFIRSAQAAGLSFATTFRPSCATNSQSPFESVAAPPKADCAKKSTGSKSHQLGFDLAPRCRRYSQLQEVG